MPAHMYVRTYINTHVKRVNTHANTHANRHLAIAEHTSLLYPNIGVVMYLSGITLISSHRPNLKANVQFSAEPYG